MINSLDETTLLMKLSPEISLNPINSSVIITRHSGTDSELSVEDTNLFRWLNHIHTSGTDTDFSFIHDVDISSEVYYELLYLMDLLCADSLIHYHLSEKKNTVAILVPHGDLFKFLKADKDQKYKLSRFVWMNFKEGKMVLECPKGCASIFLEDEQLIKYIYALQSPKSANDLALLYAQRPPSLFHHLFDMLLSMDAISLCDKNGLSEEDRDSHLMKWEFHDLLLLTQSRLGRTKKGFGATFRFVNKIPAVSPLSSHSEESLLHLPRPQSLENRSDVALNFFNIVEKRVSIREPSTKRMDLEELSTFLWYVARVKEKKEAHKNTEKQHTTMKKTVPGGGGLHEINLYLIINRVKGLESGFYFYEPFQHKLKKISDIHEEHRQIITNCKKAYDGVADPDVMISMSAKFGRINWKYESIALSIILKNAGVLYNQMYLVATALNLHPCGVGNGNSDLFSKAIQSNYYEETSVGEFILSK
ncbi:MAG: SagB/ThcOx family dehydrogenase [Chlamydiae bacterium]|nr:SagB/ThcOx family dehydrogenase [Chlamydiota bacterium]